MDNVFTYPEISKNGTFIEMIGITAVIQQFRLKNRIT